MMLALGALSWVSKRIGRELGCSRNTVRRMPAARRVATWSLDYLAGNVASASELLSNQLRGLHAFGGFESCRSVARRWVGPQRPRMAVPAQRRILLPLERMAAYCCSAVIRPKNRRRLKWV
ncbi:MAG TPA: hypothetical protein VFR86_05355, partial [Burkholderiaceae bacterium]|nr:hypothetical protein [Burkholderiaceae bacterium]